MKFTMPSCSCTIIVGNACKFEKKNSIFFILYFTYFIFIILLLFVLKPTTQQLGKEITCD